MSSFVYCFPTVTRHRRSILATNICLATGCDSKVLACYCLPIVDSPATVMALELRPIATCHPGKQETERSALDVLESDHLAESAAC